MFRTTNKIKTVDTSEGRRVRYSVYRNDELFASITPDHDRNKCWGIRLESGGVDAGHFRYFSDAMEVAVSKAVKVKVVRENAVYYTVLINNEAAGQVEKHLWSGRPGRKTRRYWWTVADINSQPFYSAKRNAVWHVVNDYLQKHKLLDS